MFFSHTTPHISQSITLANAQPLKVTMGEDTQTLDEVVVTALGIKREQKALSYNVQQVKAKKPILFALETDTSPSIDKIEDFEKIYRMVLPEKYKLFIIEFGGGYFGYANIYSLDNSSNYFIMKHKSFVPNGYLPIADNGCGDFYVLKCNGEYCSDKIYYYTHDSQEITETAYHDILEYLLDVGLKAL